MVSAFGDVCDIVAAERKIVAIRKVILALILWLPPNTAGSKESVPRPALVRWYQTTPAVYARRRRSLPHQWRWPLCPSRWGHWRRSRHAESAHGSSGARLPRERSAKSVRSSLTLRRAGLRLQPIPNSVLGSGAKFGLRYVSLPPELPTPERGATRIPGGRSPPPNLSAHPRACWQIQGSNSLTSHRESRRR